jgi:hypothetical protein
MRIQSVSRLSSRAHTYDFLRAVAALLVFSLAHASIHEPADAASPRVRKLTTEQPRGYGEVAATTPATEANGRG